MAAHTLCTLTLLAAAALAQHAPLNTPAADTSLPKLAGKRFPYNQIPYQADTSLPNATTSYYRGPQSGYNQCNSTTAGQNSLCQTAVLNSIDDFCLWAPQKPNSAIGDTEGEEVAWCTKATWGARTIPDGAITGLQFIKTPSYVLVAGYLNQELLNMPSGDYGGELDSGGQDLRGNPIGGLVYSTQLSGASGGLPAQSPLWHSFIGGGQFCFKACDMNAANAVGLCYHKLDRIGCAYNIPTAMEPDVFLSCLGDDQTPPGVYTSDGQVLTYTQPGSEITSMPYTPTIPASSACTTFSSAALFAGLPAGAGVPVDPNPSTKTSTTSTTATTTRSGILSTASATRAATFSRSSVSPSGTTSDDAEATATDAADATGAAGRSVELSLFMGAAVALLAVAARI